MTDTSAFDNSLAALSQYFHGDKTMLETLQRVSDLTTQAVPEAEFVGITMLADDRVRTAVFTDPEAPEIDRAQYDNGDGPCLDAYRTGETRRIDSTREDVRWPDFSQACLDHKILSTLSVPLTVEDTTYGALNLYSRTKAAFGPTQLATVKMFAAQAAVVLANAKTYVDARARAEQLEHALSSRAEIEQAKGIIMSTMRCSADDAFNILVQQSQRENRKLRDVAHQIVANAIRRP